MSWLNVLELEVLHTTVEVMLCGHFLTFTHSPMGAKGSRAIIPLKEMTAWGLGEQSTDWLCHLGLGFVGNKGITVHSKGIQKKKGPRPKQKNQSEMEPRNLNASDCHRGFLLAQNGDHFFERYWSRSDKLKLRSILINYCWIRNPRSRKVAVETNHS